MRAPGPVRAAHGRRARARGAAAASDALRPVSISEDAAKDTRSGRVGRGDVWRGPSSARRGALAHVTVPAVFPCAAPNRPDRVRATPPSATTPARPRGARAAGAPSPARGRPVTAPRRPRSRGPMLCADSKAGGRRARGQPRSGRGDAATRRLRGGAQGRPAPASRGRPHVPPAPAPPPAPRAAAMVLAGPGFSLAPPSPLGRRRAGRGRGTRGRGRRLAGAGPGLGRAERGRGSGPLRPCSAAGRKQQTTATWPPARPPPRCTPG